MNRVGYIVAGSTFLVHIVAGGTAVRAQYAAGVVAYNAGSTAAAGFTTASAALASPERFTGEGVFPSVVSPFSPPYLRTELVSVGEGGQITLRLSNYAVAQSAGPPEFGVFGNVGLIDTNYPNGQAGSPASGFGISSAVVEVSGDGASWFSLSSVTFDVPTNSYTDLSDPFSAAPGSAQCDFQQPFVGGLSSFNGLQYSHATNFDMLDLLAGSGGGKWLDISSSGLAQVGFVRISVADDGNPNVSVRFALDAVSVSHAALGAAVVPEPAPIHLLFLLLSPQVLTCRARSRAVG